MNIIQIMGLFDFFKKKKEEVKEEKNIIATCIVCNKPIYEHEDYKVLHWQGQKYYLHKKCFKQLKKMALKNLGQLV